jgi:mycoredoxin
MKSQVVIYGSNWCGYTVRALRQLDQLGVEYVYVDVDRDAEAEERIASWNNGRAIRPTFDMDGEIFVNPSPPVLEAELKTRGLLTDD